MNNIFLKNKHRFVQTQKNMASVNHRYFLGKRKEIPKRFFLKTLVFHTYQDTEVYVCLFVRFQFCPSPQKKLYFVNRSNYLSKINKLPNTIPPPLLVFFWYFAHRYSLGILAIFVRLWVGRDLKFNHSSVVADSFTAHDEQTVTHFTQRRLAGKYCLLNR